MTVRTYKLLGYCKGCNFMVCDVDILGESNFCPSCKIELKEEELLKEKSIKREDLKDKKKYLDNIVKESSEQHEQIPDEFYSYVNEEEDWD
jgi:hypothetical protein